VLRDHFPIFRGSILRSIEERTRVEYDVRQRYSTLLNPVKQEASMNRRGSGILLHITSLPSPYGIGDLGPWAHRYADLLAETKQSYWQVLPLNPTDPAHGNSPYSSISAFACSPLLISPDLLAEEGLITASELAAAPPFEEGRCDYARLIPYKEGLFEQAYQTFRRSPVGENPFDAFCSLHASWLDDFSLFVVLKKRFEGRVWSEWPVPLRDRHREALQAAEAGCEEELKKVKFLQYLFHRQWHSLKDDCNRKGIQLFGDLPIYVNFDSADVWANPQFFKLDEEKRPTFVSGVPPDYFSPTGQLWGNPVYRWERLRETGFEWWIRRIAHHLHFFDALRVDHFRGLVAYWEIPAGEKTAVHGRWIEVPVNDLFGALFRRFFHLPVIAEDLGVITPDVKEVLSRHGFPGMKILLFAFGENHPMHPYLPHTYSENCLAYTGTHDNNTVRGWFEKEASPDDRERVFRYLGRTSTEKEIHWELIRLAMMSVARTAIFPMQDILGLGEEGRMNRPGTTWGNWAWRLLPEQWTPAVRAKLLEMTETYGRG
jgi:4-alpha-glucanotransferase